MGLLDCIVTLFLAFKGTFVLFSMVASSAYIPTHGVGGFHLLHTIQLLLFRLLAHGHSDQCEVVPYCSLDLHFFLIIRDVKYLFHVSWPSF